MEFYLVAFCHQVFNPDPEPSPISFYDQCVDAEEVWLLIPSVSLGGWTAAAVFLVEDALVSEVLL